MRDAGWPNPKLGVGPLVGLVSALAWVGCGDGDQVGISAPTFSTLVVAGEVRDETGVPQEAADVDISVADETGQGAPTGDCLNLPGWPATATSDPAGAFDVQIVLSRFDHDVCVTVVALVTGSGGQTLADTVHGIRTRVAAGGAADTVRIHAVVR